MSLRKISVDIDGALMEATTAFAAGVLWVHLNGETYTLEAPKRQGRKSSRGGGAGNPGEIVAPMPGKIIKVMVKAEQDVQAQQVLLVMEAMKMEYTLKAQLGGRVSHILCQPGEQVLLGQIVMKIEVDGGP